MPLAVSDERGVLVSSSLLMSSEINNKVTPILDHQGVVILDGGLASELEARGANLSDELWSARLLTDDPDLLVKVHLAFLEAGADCIVSASYQATEEGFRRRGASPREAEDLLRFSVQLARRARDDFWSRYRGAERLRPLVGASVGPYGAALADGSEYRGDTSLGVSELYRFHASRWKILAASGADLMACETIPNLAEVTALGRLFDETPEIGGWVSLSCLDPEHLADGSDLTTVAAQLDQVPGVVALGINCVPPRWVPGALAALRRGTTKPLVAYPNSGEVWNAVDRRWGRAGSTEPRLAAAAPGWRAAGAQMIGGCCRTGPKEIAELRRVLVAATEGLPKGDRPGDLP